MNRRNFLKISFGTSSLLCGLGAHNTLFGMEKKVKNTSRPNLLIIQTDEHNFRTLGCYRDTLPEKQAYVWGKNVIVETPNIDWIAKNGAICTSFYASTPVCSPSRSSWISGRYPQNTPVTTNNIPLNDTIISFAELLKRAGYSTGYAGKWHLDGHGKPQWAPKRQFGFSDNRYMFNRGHWKQISDTPNGPRIATVKGKSSYTIQGATPDNFTTDYLTAKTIDFIKANQDNPFCYMVSIPDPHGPNTVRPPYDTMYKHLPFKKPATCAKPDKNLPSWATKAKKTITNDGMSKYFGMVKCIDDNVGKILKALRKLNLIDNTIVIFTSDHGDLCGEHSRDNKGVPFEASAKIPFVIYYPGKIKPNTQINEAMSSVDFLPTILSLMAVPTAGKEQGRDASVLFEKGKAPANWNDIAFMRGTGNPNNDTINWLAALTKRYKLVIAPKDEPWLYDLEKDPDELVNYFNDPKYSLIVKKLATELTNYGQKYNDPRTNDPHNKDILEKATGN